MKKLTKLEHSALLLEWDGRHIAIDPGCLTGPESRRKLRGVDAALITHRHPDHFDLDVLREINAPIFGPPEVEVEAIAAGLSATGLSVGKPLSIAGMNVMPVLANHGPAVSKPVQNYGFILRLDGLSVYVTGDMAGPQDVAPTGPFTVVAIPVEGGGFVFDATDAANFLRRLGSVDVAIPVHADDAAKMREQFVRHAEGVCRPVMLNVGEAIEL